MEQVMYSRAYLLQETENHFRMMALTFAISIIGHIIFFIVIVFAPGQLPSRRYLPTVVNVSLVSLPDLGRSSGTSARSDLKVNKQVTEPKKDAVSPESPPPKISVDQKPTKKVSVASQQWKEKISLKKETFDPSKVVKSAIEKIEKKTEESRPVPVTEAIERLRSQVGATEMTGGGTKAPGKDEKGIAAEGIGIVGGGLGTGKISSEILIYQHEISYHIRNNWVFSEELAGKRSDLETRLMIKIMANGAIRDVQFEKRSGNQYLDESAYKAIIKSNPLPPLPKGYQFYTVILGFNPSGLQ